MRRKVCSILLCGMALGAALDCHLLHTISIAAITHDKCHTCALLGVYGALLEKQAILNRGRRPRNPSRADKFDVPPKQGLNCFMYIAGGLLIKVNTKCATQHVTISLQSSSTTVSSGVDSATDASSSSKSSPQQQQQQHARVQLQMAVECVVVSMWDDERRRLLGGASSSGMAPAELCCVYCDDLSLQVTRQPAPSTGMPPLPPCVLLHVDC